MSAFLLESWESLLIAVRAIKGGKLRAVLTTLGIIIGITSVTSMVTIINGIEQKFELTISELGTDILYVQRWPWKFDSKWWEYINRPRITEDLVGAIEQRSRYASDVIPYVDTNRPVKYGSRTLSSISIAGSTPDYVRVHAMEVEYGRWYNDLEERTARNMAVIGSEIAEQLFPVETPLGKTISVSGVPFRVIGVLKKKGKGLFGETSADTYVRIPFNTFKRMYGMAYRDVSIEVKLASPEYMDAAQDELTGILRAARGLDAREEDDFVVNRQEYIREQLAPVRYAIFGTGILLTALSLLVGGIGVMNIMFVTVKERTREIGIRKAVGAKRRTILVQFLVEAVILCLVGGSIGVVISLAVSAGLNAVLPTYLPLSTVLMAFGICILIGMIFGMAPAWRAARAEPIEALRYE